MTDHNEPVVSIDSSNNLDMYISASSVSCVLRISSNNKLIGKIIPDLSKSLNYFIYRVMLSSRGYIIIQARSAFKTYNKDMIVVYTINGEKVNSFEVDELINDMVLDRSEYFIVIY